MKLIIFSGLFFVQYHLFISFKNFICYVWKCFDSNLWGLCIGVTNSKHCDPFIQIWKLYVAARAKFVKQKIMTRLHDAHRVWKWQDCILPWKCAPVYTIPEEFLLVPQAIATDVIISNQIDKTTCKRCIILHICWFNFHSLQILPSIPSNPILVVTVEIHFWKMQKKTIFH